jgi:ribosomal protein S18 acetylase RimI-like enzyme
MLNEFVKIQKPQIKSITLKVYNDNILALKFYLKNGFCIENREKNLSFLRKKLQRQMIISSH